MSPTRPRFLGVVNVIAPEVTAALGRAYDEACESYAGAPGANNSTFGTEIYHFSAHHLCKVPGLEVCEEEEPKFRVRSGGILFACHKVGTSADADIDESFPRGKGASSMIDPQLPLPMAGLGDDPESTQNATKLVIAHMGNPKDGLCAVYFCVARGGLEDEKIGGWAYTLCAWKRSAADRLVKGEAIRGDQQRAEPESEPEVKVRRRERKKDRDGNAS